MSSLRYNLRLYLVRHGESTNNSMARALDFTVYMNSRSHDPHLSAGGEAQAQAVAPLLARILDHDRQQAQAAGGADGAGADLSILHDFYCSPMWRAMQTARPIAAALGVAPRVRMDIFEHGGIFLRGEDGVSRGHPGADRAKIQAAFPAYALPDEITAQGWWRGDEEDLAACHARAIRVAHSLREEAKAAHESGEHRRVMMVSHGTFMDALVKAIFCQLPSYALYYYHNNTGVTCIDFNAKEVALRFSNRTDHLGDPEFVTY